MTYKITKNMHAQLVRNAQSSDGEVEFYTNERGDVSLRRGPGYNNIHRGYINDYRFEAVPDPKVE